MSAGGRESAGESGAIFGFKGRQARVEELSAGHDHNIEARRDLISTKNLSNQTLSAISDDRSAKSLCCRNAEPARGEPIRLREQRVITAGNATSMLVDVLKIRVFADPLGRAERCHRDNVNRC
jgi:hypothetical protein